MFVGLDSGTYISRWAGKRATAATWSELVFSDRRGENPEKFNAHFSGCVRATAILLTLSCEAQCKKQCSNKSLETCALANFAQTNAVKCVERKDKSEFRARHRIQQCIKQNLFGEIEVLKPGIVVLQGRNKQGHIHGDFFREIEAQKCGRLKLPHEHENVEVVDWDLPKWTGRSVVACLMHPSARGLALTQQSRDKEREILLQVLRALDGETASTV